MTTRNDGGPAFPRNNTQSEGMSLRDWFAGQVMAGLFAEGCVHPDNLARAAYDYADAMLAAREKEGRS